MKIKIDGNLNLGQQTKHKQKQSQTNKAKIEVPTNDSKLTNDEIKNLNIHLGLAEEEYLSYQDMVDLVSETIDQAKEVYNIKDKMPNQKLHNLYQHAFYRLMPYINQMTKKQMLQDKQKIISSLIEECEWIRL